MDTCNKNASLSSEEEKKLSLFQKAIEARNFHYENFTKWQTFFYVAVGSVLVAYCALLTGRQDIAAENTEIYCVLLKLLPIIGYVFSLIWLCSSRGYTLWWNSYMSLVKYFEQKHILKKKDEDESDMTLAVFNVADKQSFSRESYVDLTSGANFSTSRLSNAMALVSTLAWSWVCVSVLWEMGALEDACWACALTWGGSWCVRIAFPSDLSGMRDVRSHALLSDKTEDCGSKTEKKLYSKFKAILRFLCKNRFRLVCKTVRCVFRILLFPVLIGALLALPNFCSKEETVETVKIPGKTYAFGKYEVTQAQYQAVTGENPSEFKVPNLPVTNVSWDDAREFCRKLTERERAAGRISKNQEYRLPTVAEWQHACRAGTTTRFYTGDSEEDLARAAWYKGNSGGRPCPVGLKEPNAFGLCDMHGNVGEWIHNNSAWHLFLGGTYFNSAEDEFKRCQVPVELGSFGYRYGNVGFRVVLDDVE